MSITARLILSLSLLITVFWLSAAMIARSVFVEEVDEMLEDTLQGAGSRLLHAATHDRRPDAGAGASLEQDRDRDHDDDHDSEESDDRFDDWDMLSDGRSDYLAFEVRDGQDRLIMRSAGAGELLSERRERSGFYVTDDALLYSIADPASRYSVTVATARSHRDSAIAEATWALFLPMVALLALMAGTTFFLVRLFVAPVKDLSTELSKRGGTYLAPLDSAALPSELRPIAQSANLLMQRLQKAMDAERVFAANSAHELRTPIAGALAQVQQLRAEIGDGKGHVRAAEIEGALKRLANLGTRLLQLARADANLGQRQERQNLTPVLQAVVSEFTGRAVSPLAVILHDNLRQDLMVQMDADAFAIVVRNLIENAERHGASGSPIEIEVGADWTISVKNHGPVVSDEDLPTLKQRFQRGHSDAEGSGLGLAIADKLVTQSGGVLTLMSPARGYDDGFEALVKLP